PDLEIPEIFGEEIVCVNETASFSVDPVIGAINYHWQISGLPDEITTEPEINVAWNAPGSQSISVQVLNPFGCSGPFTTKTFEVLATPANAGTITGLMDVCGGNTSTYSIPPVAGASSYNWNISIPGASIASTNTEGNSIEVAFADYAQSGTLSVTPINDCGVGQSATKEVEVSTKPLPTETIWGPTVVCSGAPITYYIDEIENATAYIWNIDGVEISGVTDNEITHTWSSIGTSTVSVTPVNNSNCGPGLTETLAVIIQPNGPANTTEVLYNHNELLTLQAANNLYLNSCSSGTPCVNRVIEEAKLNILLNTGQDYEYGSNAFSAAVEVIVTGYDFNNNPLLEYQQLLSINEKEPEQLFQKNFTAAHPQLSYFE
ncbi:MAG: hypothetical protein AAFU67_18645, partial [Bacteroidota bacterium]